MCIFEVRNTVSKTYRERQWMDFRQEADKKESGLKRERERERERERVIEKERERVIEKERLRNREEATKRQ